MSWSTNGSKALALLKVAEALQEMGRTLVLIAIYLPSNELFTDRIHLNSCEK